MIQFTVTHIGVSYWQNFVSFPIHSGVESTVSHFIRFHITWLRQVSRSVNFQTYQNIHSKQCCKTYNAARMLNVVFVS